MATISNKSLAAIQQRISEFVDKEFEMNGYKWKVLEGAEGLNERLRFYKCTSLVMPSPDILEVKDDCILALLT